MCCRRSDLLSSLPETPQYTAKCSYNIDNDCFNALSSID